MKKGKAQTAFPPVVLTRRQGGGKGDCGPPFVAVAPSEIVFAASFGGR